MEEVKEVEVSISDFIKKPELVEIKVKVPGEEDVYAKFYIDDMLSLRTCVEIDELTESQDYDKIEELIKSLMKDKDGKPLVKQGERLHPIIMVESLTEVSRQIKKSLTKK